MPLDFTQIITCILVGIATGVVSALCGVGGGILMVPAFVYLLKLDQKSAIATSLAAIILTSVAASIRNSGNNLVNWKVAAATGLAAGIVAFFAANKLKSLSNLTLTRIFAVLVVIMGVQMLYSSFKTQTPKTPPAPTASNNK